jgi:hypothetical protein
MDIDLLRHRLQMREWGDEPISADTMAVAVPALLDFGATPAHIVSWMGRFTVADLASRRDVLKAIAALGGSALTWPVSRWAVALGPMHYMLLADRREERATLAAHPEADAAQAAYARWGYRKVTQVVNQLPGNPVYDLLVKPLS